MRQEYVRQNSEGNPHGFVRQVPLATISLSATEVPSTIAGHLSAKELGHLERVVVQPEKAAAERSQHVQIDRELLSRLHQTMGELGLVLATKAAPLATVADAARAAIVAVENGAYGRNDGPVRKDAFPAKAWAELRAVLLENEKSLLSVLQHAG